MHSLLLLLLLAAPAPDPTDASEDLPEEAPRVLLMYQAPDQEGIAADAVSVSNWESGTKLYTAEDAPLLAAPSATAEKRRTLPLGTEVEVVSSTEVIEVVGERGGYWYRVRSGRDEGHVFGAELTPFGYATDLDGDGSPEVATVGYTADFKIRVRVKDGKSGAVSHVDLQPTGGAYISAKGGDVDATLHAATESGIPLLEVESFVEACADYTHRFVSYTAGDGGVKPRVALELAGLTDPPTIASFDVSFDPAARSATVKHKVLGEDEQGNETVEEERTERYRLEKGVYVAR